MTREEQIKFWTYNLINQFDSLRKSNGAKALHWTNDYTPDHWICSHLQSSIKELRTLLE